MATFCSRVPIECGWSLPCNHIAFFSSSSTQSCLPHYLSGVPTHTPPSWTSLSPCLFPRDADLWQTAAAFEVSHNPQVPDTLSLLPEFFLITWHPLFSLLCSFLFLSSNFNVIVVWNHILDRLCLHSLLGDISAVAPPTPDCPPHNPLQLSWRKLHPSRFSSPNPQVISDSFPFYQIQHLIQQELLWAPPSDYIQLFTASHLFIPHTVTSAQRHHTLSPRFLKQHPHNSSCSLDLQLFFLQQNNQGDSFKTWVRSCHLSAQNTVMAIIGIR